MSEPKGTSALRRVPRRTLGLLGAVLALGVAALGTAAWLGHRGEAPPEAGSAAPDGSFAPPPGPPVLAATPEELAKEYPELATVLSDPKLGGALKDFLVAYRRGGMDGARAFAADRGFLDKKGDLTLTLLTTTDDTRELEAQLAEMKAQVVGRGDERLDVLVPFDVVEAAETSGQPPQELFARVAALKGLRGVLPMQRKRAERAAGRGEASEGTRSTHADLWHRAGFRGAGIKVGILDVELSRAREFLGTALPAKVGYYGTGCSPGTDGEGIHGVAAAEIVHEMAPDAELYLACDLGDEEAAIAWLRQQGVRIISFSVGGMFGQRNGKGYEERGIDRLAGEGVLWVSAAGNDGMSVHHGQLEGDTNGGWHLFPGGRQAMAFRSGADPDTAISLIWDEWNAGTVSNYDLYLFDAKMHEIARGADDNSEMRTPEEYIRKHLPPNQTFYVGVRGGAGARASPFLVDVSGSRSIEWSTPLGSLDAPADATQALSVGAVNWDTSKLAPYSSRGPTTDCRIKPDISGPTDVSSLVYGHRFQGTSSATPHVAGAAALVWARFPEWTRDQVVAYLLARARDLGRSGPDNEYGAGVLDLGDPALARLPANARVGPLASSDCTAVETPAAPAPASPAAASGALVGVLAGIGFVAIGGVGVFAVVVLLLARRPAPAAGRAAPAFVPPRSRWEVTRQPVVPTPAAAAPNPRRAWLVPLTGPRAGAPVSIVAPETTIGRASGNAVVIPDAKVSTRHATIRPTATDFWLLDAGSANGTFVNGARVTQHLLKTGDLIVIGPEWFRFEMTTAEPGARAHTISDTKAM